MRKFIFPFGIGNEKPRANMAPSSIQKAFDFLRILPRISLNNIENIYKPKVRKRGRGQFRGKTHGCGTKGSKQRQNYMRVGYETGNNPFYLRVPQEPYYKGHHLRREYPPLTLNQLQLMIDTNRLNPKEPIDITNICNTKLYHLRPFSRDFGVNLKLDGVNNFTAKINIEVQWTSEAVIAAIEKNGGTITTAYYDIEALFAAMDPLGFFRLGKPIPRRLLPPKNALEFYMDPKNRGYLADPEKIAEERFALAQKYGYKLPNLEEDPECEMLLKRKDPRQLFYGLEPGWVVSLKDKLILKPKDPHLQEYYRS